MEPGSKSDLQVIDGVVAVVHSEALQRLMAMVKRIAPYPNAVLITGETGSGKELVARAIHGLSLRHHQPWVDVNCAALPEHLVESELFGYEKGAFSGADSAKPGFFEMANKGTLFLDEIGELDPRVQVKLLRVLDNVSYYRLGGNKKIAVDVRVIAATNRNLEEEVAAGRFRRDLYHRLSQIQLHVPPLRERREDLIPLAEHFLAEHRHTVKFSPEVIDLVKRYSWPGNVRELKNVISKAAMTADGDLIRLSDLPREVLHTQDDDSNAGPLLEGDLDGMERRMIEQALKRSGGDQTKAAKQLGISRRTLSRKLKVYSTEVKPPVLGKFASREQRYFRAAINIPLLLKCDGLPEQTATTVNISSDGVGVVDLSHPPEPGKPLELQFQLPETSTLIHAEGQLTWMDNSGRAGIQFDSIEPRALLQDWLMQQMVKEGWVESAKAGR
ncbi:MAG: sigma 54-interacting transcriptional regulator [Acidobacteriales bacterium]|nr:sigma 54-interacting transcriptional regulator [Terriglobales bacterium]